MLKVTPHSQATRVKSKALYENGRLEIEIKSAAVMPGVVTAVYLTNGDGRKSDEVRTSVDILWSCVSAWLPV